jgi:hypothetical protein
MKINTVVFYLLPKGAHYSFFGKVIQELAQAGSDVITTLGSLVAELNDWYEKEKICMRWIRKSNFTALIADARYRLTNALVGMSAQIHAMRYNTNPMIAESAERLYIMLKSYGKVISMPYLQEAGVVKAILRHLNHDLATDVLTVGLMSWKMEIENALDDFESLFQQRQLQTLGKPKQNFLEVRRGIEKVWREIALRVNSGAALGVSPDFVDFIKSVNPEIEYLNKEFHRVKHNISVAEPAPIDPQPYTGEACTPVPEVILKKDDEMVKLVLGKDFNVTYKKNINVGNANCIIHGKGAYKGSKMVTFIIKHF